MSPFTSNHYLAFMLSTNENNIENENSKENENNIENNIENTEDSGDRPQIPLTKMRVPPTRTAVV